MMEGGTPLQKALRAGLAPNGDLEEELYELDDYTIESVEDARAICEALEQVVADLPTGKGDRSLHALVTLFQDVEGDEAPGILDEHGLPTLLKAFDRLAETKKPDANDVLFIMKIFAIYSFQEGLERIPDLIQKPAFQDAYLWTVVFEILSIEGHPAQVWVADQLRDPLPQKFAQIAYLDFVNELCRQGVLESHPFDTPDGKKDLARWIKSKKDHDASYAVSAAMALAFVSNPERDDLFEIARSHNDILVQIEAAWSEGFLGRESGLKFLARMCLDPSHAARAMAFLEMLDREDCIPEKARDPNFQAMAEMSSWLAHPNEYGGPPDSIELIDTREIYWPPAEEKKQVWAFRYSYKGRKQGEEETDYGMVGSITFSLFGDYGDNPSPEDIYALHCAWEADGEPDLERGREMLKGA